MNMYKISLAAILITIVLNTKFVSDKLDSIANGQVIEPLYEKIFITEDRNFVYIGDLRDTLNDHYYTRYKRMQPVNSSIKYRIQAMNFFKIWKWADYLSNPEWRLKFLMYNREDAIKKYRQFADINQNAVNN